VQYQFKQTGTTINAIYERLERKVPASLTAQNERTRNGYWLADIRIMPKHDMIFLVAMNAGNTISGANSSAFGVRSFKE